MSSLIHSSSRRNQPRHGLWIAGIIVFMTTCLYIGIFVRNDNKPQAAVAAHTPKVAKKESTGVTSKVLFTGDIFLGRNVHKWSQESPLKYAYPFSGLSDFHRDTYDAWVGNLECPTVPGVLPTKSEEQVQLKFNCQSEYLPELTKWFDIVSIANNHTDNQGASGFTSTKEQLDKNKIQYFGTYDPSALSDVCTVTGLPVHVTLSDRTAKTGILPFAFCGYHGVFKIPSEESLAVMQKYSKYMPVIAYPHMGTEYRPSADTLRTNLYHKMIDNGADAVLASHPHWVQNSEAYKGKLIVYSMGNFIFDQTWSEETMHGAAITMELKSDKSIDTTQLETWLKLGPECVSANDVCLVKAEQQQLKRLPLQLTFGIQAVDISSHITKPGDATLTKTIADRLNWNQTAAQLQPTGNAVTTQ